MGSSGMKRKGRSHLPKVGTRPAVERDIQDRRAEALHPFSSDPWQRGTSYGIMAVIVAVVVAIGIVALIAAT